MRNRRLVVLPIIVIILSVFIRVFLDVPITQRETSRVTSNDIVSGFRETANIIDEAFAKAKSEKDIEAMTYLFEIQSMQHKKNESFLLKGYGVISSFSDLIIIIMVLYIFFVYVKRKT